METRPIRTWAIPAAALAAAAWMTCLAGCGSGGGGDDDAGFDGGPQACDLAEHPCPAGQRCDAEQQCVAADPLAIATDSLPPGRVGFGYDQTLEATGGLTPYTWELAAADPALDFLSLSSSGRLRGTPGQPVLDGSLTVAVVDAGYGGGQRVERTLSLTVDLCRDGDTELCYAPADGVCYQGARTCTAGEMGDCEPGADPSADHNQCGPDCGSCPADVADTCRQGLCACGDGALCSAPDHCCDGACLDVASSDAHCGMCFHDCAQAVAHAETAETFCQDGVCDYSGDCDYGYLDCDGQRANGCERPADRVEACGACDRDCGQLVVHVPSAQKVCRDTGDGFVCDYTGTCTADFADCDQQRDNGCETWLTQPEACGACGVDCSADPAGTLCVTPDQNEPYDHRCGCNFLSESGQAEGCAGPDPICCGYTCRDAASDPDNCGVCRAACTSGGCVAGACGCSADGDCPAPSGAPACGPADRCVCPHGGDGQAACPPGQFCCDGEHNGSGGPNGDPDLGCCPKQCGQNDADNYPCTQ